MMAKKKEIINAKKVLNNLNKDRLFIQAIDKKDLEQFNSKELNELDDLLEQCEDICYKIKGKLNQPIKKTS